MKLFTNVIVLLGAIVFSASGSIPKSNNLKQINPKGGGTSFSKPSETMADFALRVKQGFNMRVWISNQMTMGLQAWDGEQNTPDGYGMEYPAGSGVEHIYGAGPRIGGIIDGVIRVDEAYNGSDARKEFLPEWRHLYRERIWRTSIRERIDHSTGKFYPNILGYDDDGDGRVDEDDLDGTDNDGDWDPILDDVGEDGISDSLEVGCLGAYDPVTNPDPAYDNFRPGEIDKCHPNPDGTLPIITVEKRDYYTEKNGLPDHGEPHVDEDYGAISDQDYYCSAIDTFIQPIYAGHVPMWIKLIQKSYAWDGGSAEAILPFEYIFINMGRKLIRDVCIGFFADCDVGPSNISRYYERNYSTYDDTTKTAYVHNPIDIGSTPIGFTLLGSTKPLDSLSFIWQWSDFTTQPDPGTNDSAIYSWMSGEAFPGQPIAPNQSPDNLSDTRFFFSIGKFDSMKPGDTLKISLALVSGMSIPEMLTNAQRARRIYKSNGFIMPVVHISDSGAGAPITIYWNAIDHSPYGNVTSYRVYHGPSSGNYTDSVETGSLSTTFSGLPGNQIYYFAVAAIDDKGNLSALSDEITNAPYIPMGLVVSNQQTSIVLEWNANPDPDIAGYNIYRRTSVESTLVKITPNLITVLTYIDTDVWGDKIYHYCISAVDHDGHESGYSLQKSGRLIPPAIPSNFVVGPGKDFLHLSWSPNKEEDLVGYNIYKRLGLDSDFIKLHSDVWTSTQYIDYIVVKDVDYYYFIEAIDSTDAVSSPSYSPALRTALMDEGIFAVNSYDYSIAFPSYRFCESLLVGYKHRTIPYRPPVYIPGYVNELGKYSSILWMEDSPPGANLTFYPPAFPIALKGYLLGGGNLLLMGRGLPSQSFPHWYEFLSEYFGISPFFEVDSTFDFAAAVGEGEFPTVFVDTIKPSSTRKRLNYIERFSDITPVRVLYRYRSDPFDPLREGKPIGIRAIDPNINAYYLSFPLYYLDSADARELLVKILTDFDEKPMGTGVVDRSVPNEFRLFDAYPNPFNPSTKIRFDLPHESRVTLIVYDLLGREVERLIDDETLPAGSYNVEWNPSASSGQMLSNGVYLYRLNAQSQRTNELGNYSKTMKVILMK